jgi:hypothetical protein
VDATLAGRRPPGVAVGGIYVSDTDVALMTLSFAVPHSLITGLFSGP